MTHHPKERYGGLNRRDFLLRSAVAASALSGASGLLAACSSSTTAEQTTIGSTGAGEPEPLGPGGLPLARPHKRVELPLWEDPIESGLEPETGGTFTVYNYPDYFYKKLLTQFGKDYGVKVKYTPFDNIASGIQRLASGAVQPDIMEMTPDNLDLAVAGKLIKPINIDYVPNLAKNIWPELVTRSTTSTRTTRCRTRATRPESRGGTTRSLRTSPRCRSRGTSSGRRRPTPARPPS